MDNLAPVKLTRSLKEEAQHYIGDYPKKYPSISRFMDDAVRTLLRDLESGRRRRKK